jgi:hypothetical protein
MFDSLLFKSPYLATYNTLDYCPTFVDTSCRGLFRGAINAGNSYGDFWLDQGEFWVRRGGYDGNEICRVHELARLCNTHGMCELWQLYAEIYPFLYLPNYIQGGLFPP